MAVLLAAALLCGSAAGLACDRQADPAVPVATPSVTLSRSEAPIGSPLEVTYRFEVAPDAPRFAEDYLVFVHFLDVDRERMWADDHEPATPTTQWAPGQTIEYTRTVFVPRFPYVGPATIELGLYSPRSGERLPLAGADSGLRAYRVAAFEMRLQSENALVIFTDGWHETEVAESEEGLEWQWSRQEGTVAFRNPNRDADLYLQLDQPVNAFPDPQRVEVRLGDTVVDSFALPVGVREVRRIPLSASVLGAADTVEVTIAVDKTFVPATVPGLQSSDVRQLGVRVFRAYLEPK